FKVDLATTEKLSAEVNLKNKILVGESGINSRADVERLERFGVKAILVGECLIKTNNISAKVSELLGG
ncbi:MAG: indole-3-glycerol-phosphate synthase TrpC, partial [Verrucomicrobiota bacterium]|nr:indole-3-glycerol-phosphate synthase TrpC [Verrucomicrobiota bacterium]